MKTILVTYFDNVLRRTQCRAYVVSELRLDDNVAWLKKTLKRECTEGFCSKVKISVIDRISTTILD